MSSSSSADGSSSTTMAMFCIAFLKRRGIEASASATRPSNCFRFTGSQLPRLLWRLAGACSRDDQPEVVAVIPHRALVAERFGPADAPAVEDQRIGSARPALGRHRGRQLLLDDDGV